MTDIFAEDEPEQPVVETEPTVTQPDCSICATTVSVRLCFACDRPLCDGCTVAASGFAVCNDCKQKGWPDVLQM